MNALYTWAAIVVLVLESTAGDILLARAMKGIGDLGDLRRSKGLYYSIRAVMANRTMLLGIFFMALAFFTLLFALSWGDVSLVVPASASLTFITNAIAAKIILHEDVDKRRLTAALLVAGGVAMLAT
jgi:drug/metabolite transporter (DMT)-like permease